MCVCMLSHVQLFATPWTVAHQAPLFMGFSRQEYWSGLPLPSPEKQIVVNYIHIKFTIFTTFKCTIQWH